MRRRLVAAELVRLACLRTSWVLLALSAAVAAASSVGIALAADRIGVDLATAEGRQAVLHGAGPGALLALVFGVLVTAGKYRHRTVTDTYLTTPRRGRVIAAKLTAGLAAGLLTGVLAAAATLLAASWALSAQGHPLSLGEGVVWLTVLGVVAWCAGFACVGVALGALVRNQVVACVAGLAWLVVAEPIVVNAAPAVGRWLPGQAGDAVGRAPTDGLLPQWGGGLLLAAYTAAVALLAARTSMRRDVT